MKTILLLAMAVAISSCCVLPKCGPNEKFKCPKTSVYEDLTGKDMTGPYGPGGGE